jgi:hypothetical protein
MLPLLYLVLGILLFCTLEGKVKKFISKKVKPFTLNFKKFTEEHSLVISHTFVWLPVAALILIAFINCHVTSLANVKIQVKIATVIFSVVCFLYSHHKLSVALYGRN